MPETTLDTLQRAEHRGSVHSQPLACIGQRSKANQSQHCLQIGRTQPVLR
jgi:hypothetical protein